LPNHHYLPQSYLRRFSNSRGQIRVYKAGTNAPPFKTSIRNVAAEVGFYQVDVAGESPEGIEQLLSKYEERAKSAFGNVLAGRFPPSAEDRWAIASFLGLQMERTPENRRLYEMTVDRRMKMVAHAMTPQHIKAFLENEGLDASAQEIARWSDTFARVEDFEFRPQKAGKRALSYGAHAGASAENRAAACRSLLVAGSESQRSAHHNGPSRPRLLG
jgi:hypothetical protein